MFLGASTVVATPNIKNIGTLITHSLLQKMEDYNQFISLSLSFAFAEKYHYHYIIH
jgi:hypothetical protein